MRTIPPALERLVVRPAQPADIPAQCALLETLFALESDFVFDAAKAERGLRMLLERDDALLLTALADESVVGMCSVQILISTAEGGPVGVVEDVVVAENWRKRGIAGRLLQAVEQWATARGLTRLQLLADADNDAALAFYRRAGWDETRLVCRRRRLG